MVKRVDISEQRKRESAAAVFCKLTVTVTEPEKLNQLIPKNNIN